MTDQKTRAMGKLGIPKSPCSRCTRRQCFGTSSDPFDRWFRRAWRRIQKFYGTKD